MLKAAVFFGVVAAAGFAALTWAALAAGETAAAVGATYLAAEAAGVAALAARLQAARRRR